MHLLLALFFSLIVAGCPVNPNIPVDPDGPETSDPLCSIEDNGDGSKTITCDDGTTGIVYDGEKGEKGDRGEQGPAGEAGEDGEDGIRIIKYDKAKKAAALVVKKFKNITGKDNDEYIKENFDAGWKEHDVKD